MLDKLRNSINGHGKGFSREDLRNYAASHDESEKQRIELASLDSDFDADAFDGWEALGYDSNKLSKLDQRFKKTLPGHYLLFWIGTTAILTIGIFLALQYKSTTPLKKISSEMTQFQIEETEIIPIEILNLPEVPSSIQIKSAALQNDYKRRKLNETPAESTIQTLPLRKPEATAGKENQLISQRKLMPEIYLEEFKLVDYKNREAIQTKRLNLYGTPANQESKEEAIEQFNWENYTVSYNDYMGKTMHLLSKNEYKSVISRLKLVVQQFPEDLNVYFYMGFAYYNLGLYNEASVHFDKCLQLPNTNFDQEALWFKALTLEQGGKKYEAQMLYRTIAENNGFYSVEARKKIDAKM